MNYVPVVRAVEGSMGPSNPSAGKSVASRLRWMLDLCGAKSARVVQGLTVIPHEMK